VEQAEHVRRFIRRDVDKPFRLAAKRGVVRLAIVNAQEFPRDIGPARRLARHFFQHLAGIVQLAAIRQAARILDRVSLRASQCLLFDALCRATLELLPPLLLGAHLPRATSPIPT
jgi:hypothetical protein